ncbi:MAG: septal ring lytic transglycosylase RlpA family protein [Beijerinckiaceae bacterium]
MRLTVFSRFTADAMAKFGNPPRFGGQIALRPLFIAALAACALDLAGCAQPPGQRLAQSKEYFPASTYGPASPRVVAENDPVPHGGGTYLVGKPYTVAGKTYYPDEKRYAAVGYASWYGDAFHGRRTANGEIFDRTAITAAHPTMPLPSYARVTNLRNKYSIIVRVNDRGPFAAGRIMDVSRQTADALDFRHLGTTKVKVEYVGPANLAGSDDRKLLATLRIDGAPAKFDGGHPPTLLAAATPLRTASAETANMPPARDEAAILPGQAFAGTAPLPPARPFDLGTIPGAGVPIAQR